MKIIKTLFWGTVLFCLLYFATDFKISGKTFKQHVDDWAAQYPVLGQSYEKVKNALNTNVVTKQMIDTDDSFNAKKWKKENEEITKKESEQLTEIFKKNK